MISKLYHLSSLQSSSRLPLIHPSTHVYSRSKYLFSKPIVLILFWQFFINLAFNVFASPSFYIKSRAVYAAWGMSFLIGIVFLFSPIAGFIADIKLGQFKVLLHGTYMITFSTLMTALVLFIASVTIYSYNNYFVIMCTLFSFGEIFLWGGYVAFEANILQFATSQLRDAPTDCSVLYLHASFWSTSASSVIALLANIPGHQSTLHPSHKIVKFDTLQISVILVIRILSAFGLLAVTFVLHKKKEWFFTDMIKSNPYKLILKVLKYAWYHDKPIQRSAFTYSEDEKYGRLDFAKSICGGPFTVPQIEDVKVMIQILKVLFSAGPIFLLQTAVRSSLLTHVNEHDFKDADERIKVMIIDYGMLTPLLALFFIPTYQCLVRPFFPRFIPNMLQRIGLALFMSLVSLFLYLLIDIFSYYKNDGPQLPCTAGNSTYLLNHHYFHIPSTCMYVIHHILNSLCEVLLYIALWEFICCQTPQDMKGMTFGLLYAIRGFYQFMGATIVLPFFGSWSSEILSCSSAYYLLHLAVGIVSFIGYIYVAKTYKYRKRDEFCDVYYHVWKVYSNDLEP